MGNGEPWTVVGVIDDQRTAEAVPTGPEVFVLYRQVESVGSQPALVIRTAGDPMSDAPFARALVRGLQPDLAIGSILTLEDRFECDPREPSGGTPSCSSDWRPWVWRLLAWDSTVSSRRV